MKARVSDPPLGGTIDLILALLPSLNPGAQRVARICVERAEDVVGMTGADLAEAGETSPATVSRMSKALGFHSFQHLRFMLVRDLAAAGSQDPVARAEGTAGWLSGLADSAGSMLQTSLAGVDADVFDAAADAIARAPRLLVAGSGASGPSAQSAAVSFITNGRSCEAPTDGVMQQLTASVLEPGDVCLVVSSSGANSVTLAVASAAAEAGATVVGVTSFAKAPLADRVDRLLVAGARFRSWDPGSLGSSLAQILLLSALQMAVSERMSDTADRARDAVRGQVLGIVEESDDETDAARVSDDTVGR
ncbi:MurR/RpiR family transcriptional regulator [Microbacterium sp. G2-8]|uniref:MurR/RpiR family transcriptional regulator n=1 Tax=Microbacterium sp. G2-8 TaxID=2842454 RepID=UPI001C8A0E7C|nr:MurR/RpiR family transcriptional regulator [Microbacterium sp. G2-8]